MPTLYAARHVFTCEWCSADHDRFDVPATFKRPCTDDHSDGGDHVYACTAHAVELGWVAMIHDVSATNEIA